MRSEQRERLVALAARVAAEKDPVRFHALLLELEQILQGNSQPSEQDARSESGDGKK